MSQLASERALNIDNENVTIEGNVEKEEAQNSSPVVVQGVKVFSDDFEDSDEDESPFPKWLDGDSLAPFLPTPGVWLDDLFHFANISTDDIVCDVGCGDGRIPIWAVQRFQAKRGIGIEIDKSLVEVGQQNAKDRKVDDRVDIFLEMQLIVAMRWIQ